MIASFIVTYVCFQENKRLFSITTSILTSIKKDYMIRKVILTMTEMLTHHFEIFLHI